jgi:hypothetical protein
MHALSSTSPRKDVKWEWSTDEQSAFDKLKSLITSTPILASPDNSRPFRVEADSSDFATGAVLSQQSPDDEKWHPVAFLSKSLSAVERNYEIHDKEMLAIIRAMEEWRHFLEGAEHKFEVCNSKQKKKTKQTIRNECCIFRLKSIHSDFTDFIVLSRLLYPTFWTLRLSRAMTILQIMRKTSSIVRHIRTFFKNYTNLNYI